MVGSASGQKQSVKFLQNMVHTAQFTPPPPRHTLRHLILSVPLSLARMMTSGWPLQPSYSDWPGDQAGGWPLRGVALISLRGNPFQRKHNDGIDPKQDCSDRGSPWIVLGPFILLLLCPPQPPVELPGGAPPRSSGHNSWDRVPHTQVR